MPTDSSSLPSAPIILPYPPSYNTYWRTGKFGSHISAEGKRYKKEAAAALLQYRVSKISGPVIVHLDYFRPIRSGDLDNRFKQVLDALQGVCYDNDSQIAAIHATRSDDKANPRVEIRVEAGETEAEPARPKSRKRVRPSLGEGEKN